MTIFFNNLKRIFRRKSNIVIMFIFPILFISAIAAFSNGGSGLSIGIVDNDHTKLTAILKTKLKDKGTIEVITKNDINDYIIDKKIDTAVVIPKGFTKSIINSSKTANIDVYGIKGVSNDSSIKYYINSFTNAAQNIAAAAKGDKTKFYKGIKDYEKGNFSSIVKSASSEKSKEQTSSTAIGFLIASIIYLSTMITTLILEDKKDGVYNRMFASGVSKNSYIIQCVLSFVTANIIQILGVFLVIKYMLKVDLGPSPASLFVVLVVFGLTCTALGILISNRSKDLKQANSMTVLISTPVAMLGGCYWPKEVMGKTLQQIGNFVPSSWAMDAASKLISGNSFASIYKEIGVMFIFVAVFFVLAVVKKVDVAK